MDDDWPRRNKEKLDNKKSEYVGASMLPSQMAQMQLCEEEPHEVQRDSMLESVRGRLGSNPNKLEKED